MTSWKFGTMVGDDTRAIMIIAEPSFPMDSDEGVPTDEDYRWIGFTFYTDGSHSSYYPQHKTCTVSEGTGGELKVTIR